MRRPIIGITGELEAARWGNWIREAVVSPVTYTRAVERAGGTPVVLPPVPAHSVPALVAGLDGVVVTGGGELDLSLYEEEPHEQTEPPDHRRDRFELAVMRAVIDADLPFLAVSRGMHVLNLVRGAPPTQHAPAHPHGERHSQAGPGEADDPRCAAQRREPGRPRVQRRLGEGAGRAPSGDQQDRQRAPHRGVDPGSGGGGRRTAA